MYLLLYVNKRQLLIKYLENSFFSPFLVYYYRSQKGASKDVTIFWDENLEKHKTFTRRNKIVFSLSHSYTNTFPRQHSNFQYQKNELKKKQKKKIMYLVSDSEEYSHKLHVHWASNFFRVTLTEIHCIKITDCPPKNGNQTFSINSFRNCD